MSVKDRDAALAALSRSEARLREATHDLERARAALGTPTIEDIGVRFGVSEEVLVAFAQAAGELLGPRTLSIEAARRAGLLAASETAWEDELGPLLTSAQVRELLGDVSRQRVGELLRERRLMGLLDRGGRRRFPAFQFHDGRPQPALIDAYWTIADGAESDRTAASWCVASDDQLDGLAPYQWAREGRDAERLALVARRDAARLAQ